MYNNSILCSRISKEGGRVLIDQKGVSRWGYNSYGGGFQVFSPVSGISFVTLYYLDSDIGGESHANVSFILSPCCVKKHFPGQSMLVLFLFILFKVKKMFPQYNIIFCPFF